MKTLKTIKTNGDTVVYSEGVIIGIIKFIKTGLFEYNGKLYDRRHMALRDLYRANGITQ